MKGLIMKKMKAINGRLCFITLAIEFELKPDNKDPRLLKVSNRH